MERTTRQLYCRTPGGLSLSVRAWGDGPPELLLVHGFGDNGCVWNHFASTLDDRCCLLAVELRGHGRSGWDPTGAYALEGYVADVVQVLEEFCPAPIVLVGHSLGAQIAIRAAAARRELIRAMVVVDFGFKPSPLSASHVRRKFRERRRVYAAPAEYVALLRGQLPLAEGELLDDVAEGALRVNADGRFEERSDPMLVNTDDSIDTQATLTALKQIARPILLVRGEGSAILSRAAARELLAQVPQSRLSAVAAAGHTVMLDNPDGFCAAVRPYVLKLLSQPVAASAAG